MKMQFKPIFYLLGGLLGLLMASVLYQQYRNVSSWKRLSTENSSTIEAAEWKAAENVFLSAEHAVSGSLERGEMEKFIKLLEAQRNLKGLLEFSLYDRQGCVTHSSDPKFLKNKLPEELRSKLLSSTERIQRVHNGAFEIYKPEVVHADCLRCHTSWKTGMIGGVTAFRFSTDSLTESQAKTTAAVKSLRTKQILDGALSAMVVMGLFVVLAFAVVRYQIAAPLLRIIQRLTATSEKVASTSSHLAVTSKSMAADAGEQASSLEETSASLEEMATMTRQNADHAQSAKDLANQARTAAEAGSTSMQQMNQAMDAIKESSRSIGMIIKTIDEIAFQTNILALNAAVEAARAGEAGMGFSVVANEVRNLAQRSAQAARETAAKIEDSMAKSERGVNTSAEVTASLQTIVEKVCKVDDLIADIAMASKQQNEGITQINTAMAQIDKITQSNAGTSQESAQSADELKAEAHALQSAVDDLQKMMGGGADSANSGPHNEAIQQPVADHRHSKTSLPQPSELGIKPLKSTAPGRRALERQHAGIRSS